jgi:hypothetical protein
MWRGIDSTGERVPVGGMTLDPRTVGAQGRICHSTCCGEGVDKFYWDYSFLSKNVLKSGGDADVGEGLRVLPISGCGKKGRKVSDSGYPQIAALIHRYGGSYPQAGIGRGLVRRKL